MSNRPLRILHISDLHERADVRGTRRARRVKLSWDAEQRGRVLGLSFLEALATNSSSGIDLVVFTGDVTDTGHPTEYRRATQRIDTMLEAVKVPRNRFFAIPGNHDVQRRLAEAAWRGIRRWLAEHKNDAGLQSLGRWAFGGAAPAGIDQIWRSEVLQRTAAFWKWLQRFTGTRFLQSASLGYRYTIHPDALPHVGEPLHIIGLDSAWLCGADDAEGGTVLSDQGSIVVTEAQVERHTREGAQALDGYRIVLIHHPLEYLADHVNVRRLLADGGADILLHGHQHDPGVALIDEPGAKIRLIAAGCLMEGDLGRNWPNGFNLIEIQFPSRAGAVHFRQWSSRTRSWGIGSDIYRNAHDGIVRWTGDESWLPTTPPVAVSANGNDALVLHKDGALALWRRDARAPWWTRKAQFFDVRDPPMRTLASQSAMYKAVVAGDHRAMRSGEYRHSAATDAEFKAMAAIWRERVAAVGVFDENAEYRSGHVDLMRAASEFSEAFEDPQRWLEWLGTPPPELSVETWFRMGASLGFRAARAGRGKKYDISHPPNPLRFVEAPPDQHGGLVVVDLDALKIIWHHELSWPDKWTYAMARVAISEDGGVVALGDLDLEVWRVGEDQPLVQVRDGKERAGPIKDLAVSPDGGAVAVGRNAGGLELWNTRNAVRARLVRGQVFEALTWAGPYTLVVASNARVKWIDVG